MAVGELKGKAVVDMFRRLQGERMNFRIDLGEETFHNLRIADVFSGQLTLFHEVPPPVKQGFVRGSFPLDNIFYRFETDLTGYDFTRSKGQSVFRWILHLPDTVDKLENRPERVVPQGQVFAQRAAYNKLRISYILDRFINNSERHKILSVLSSYLAAEKTEVKKVDQVVYSELFKVAGLNEEKITDVSEIRKHIGIDRLTDQGRETLGKEGEAEIFIEDTQDPGLPSKSREVYEERNIGSLAIIGINLYQGGLVGRIKCATTLSGGKKLTKEDFEYIKALTASARAARNKALPIKEYPIIDISENGLAVPTSEFRDLPPEHSIGTFELHLGKSEGKEFVNVALRFIRTRKDGVAFRIDYMGAGARASLRYVRTKLREWSEEGDAKT